MAEELIYGIDVSHHNGSVNWSKVRQAEPAISFAYIKATQGVGYKDPATAANANGAKAAGIKIGYYHFASLNNAADVVKDATNEAEWFDATLETMPPAELMPVLDIETNEKHLNTQQVQLWISTFLERMKALGYPVVVLYSYKPFFDDNLPANHPFGEVPLWLAQYRNVAAPALPHGWTKYTIWQYSAKGKVNGINGDCDMNRAVVEFRG
ncbi:MAG: glycoside hydrolase family 25 protein [Bacteroidota bacterium]|nr:glycoside hydrolase family 25 protein [Bacteroidota bacterium]